MEILSLYLIDEHDADIANNTFKGDEITLLGETPTLGVNEADEEEGYVRSGMRGRLLKNKSKISEMGVYWK